MADPLASDYASPDASDTGGDSLAPTFGNFDELNQFGVSPNLEKIPVMVNRKKRVMADAPSGKGEVPAYPERYEPEMSIFGDVAKSFYSSSFNIPDFQTKATAAGFYGKNPDYIFGSPDKKSYLVWQDILKQASRSGKTPGEVIDEAVEANGGLEEGLKKHRLPGSSSPSVPDIPVTHPDDIRMVAKKISRETLGKGWDAKQLDAFVQAYQSMEKAEGTAAQGQGATVQRAPSLQAAAESEARRQNPVAAGATDWDNAAQMMINAFKTLGGAE